jgi:hypothetical protein
LLTLPLLTLPNVTPFCFPSFATPSVCYPFRLLFLYLCYFQFLSSFIFLILPFLAQSFPVLTILVIKNNLLDNFERTIGSLTENWRVHKWSHERGGHCQRSIRRRGDGDS